MTNTILTPASNSIQYHTHSQPVLDTVVAAYYADWASNQLSPEEVDFGRFNWIDFGQCNSNGRANLANHDRHARYVDDGRAWSQQPSPF